MRLLIPEVVQTSAMDCGPASLKCLLEGFGISVSYGRLREACQTDVDGTSIDTMEEVAVQLGLDAEQVMIPTDHVLLPDARFDNNPLNVRDPASESARTFADLLERGSSSPWSLNAVSPDLESAELLAERLRALESVSRVVTLSDFVPRDQQEKLDIIEDVSLFLTPLPAADGSIPAPTLEERLNALRSPHETWHSALDHVTDAGLATRRLRAFCDDDERVVFTRGAALRDHVREDLRTIGDLRDQDAVRSTGNPGMQRDPSRVAAHDLDQDHTVVTVRRVAKPVERFGSDVDRRVEAEGLVGTVEIVVDGLGNPNDAHALVG